MDDYLKVGSDNLQCRHCVTCLANKFGDPLYAWPWEYGDDESPSGVPYHLKVTALLALNICSVNC